MPKAQSRLTVALLFTALASLTFFVTVFISAPIDFMYRNAAGLGSVRSIAQIVSLLAVAVLFIAGFIITVPVALQPSSWLGKIGKVLPIFFLLVALVAVISAFLGVGQVGNLLNLQGVGAVTFAAAFLAVGAVLSIIAVIITAARANLSPSVLKSATRTTVAASGLSVIATVAMLASVAIVSTSQPSFGGPGGGFPGGPEGGNRPGAAGQAAPGQNNGTSQGQRPETTREPQGGAASSQNNGAVPSGVPGQGRPESTGEPQASAPINQNVSASIASPSGRQGQQPEATGEPQGGSSGRQNQGQGRPQGFPQGGEGRPEGGPGGFGNPSTMTNRYAIGGGLMAVFALVGLISGLMALRQLPSVPVTSPMPVNYPREAGLALLTAVGIGLVVVGVAQLVPVTRTNPPVKTPINWDSDQTKRLAYASCMDCHSNETTWPWYASIAPSSWLTTLHVNDARQEMNLSEMDSMPTFRRRNLAQDMAEQIRSGNMPPKDYLILHPDARLTDAEKQQLIDGLQKSLSSS